MLLIAHPDDESMFFSPFLFHNQPDLILCLSSGNYNQKGEVRKLELERLCKERGWKLKIMKHKDGANWNENQIGIEVLENCALHGIKKIVTFDHEGVSGHKNHISCHLAAKKIQKLSKGRVFQFFYLKSTNILEKYFFSFSKSHYSIPFFSLFSIRNMLYHRSQLEWFRWIYIIFSNYMSFNVINS